VALDAQWHLRGLTWQQAMHEINRLTDRKSSGHPIARSTVSGRRTKAVAEVDGVLQMLRWLNRTPRSFMPAWSPRYGHAIRLGSDGKSTATLNLLGNTPGKRVGRSRRWRLAQDHERYEKLIVEVADPRATVALLNGVRKT